MHVLVFTSRRFVESVGGSGGTTQPCMCWVVRPAASWSRSAGPAGRLSHACAGLFVPPLRGVGRRVRRGNTYNEFLGFFSQSRKNKRMKSLYGKTTDSDFIFEKKKTE